MLIEVFRKFKFHNYEWTISNIKFQNMFSKNHSKHKFTKKKQKKLTKMGFDETICFKWLFKVLHQCFTSFQQIPFFQILICCSIQKLCSCRKDRFLCDKRQPLIQSFQCWKDQMKILKYLPKGFFYIPIA